MLDIKLLRENPELVRDNLKKRRNPRYLQLLDELVEHDTSGDSL
jgi:seryl-tRNA synthetase